MPTTVTYSPSAANAAALGGALDLLQSAVALSQTFAPKPAMLALLPGGELYFDTQLALDTDGWPEGRGKGDKYWDPDTSYHLRSGTPMNADTVPYVVLPQPVAWADSMGIFKGDIATVLYKGRIVHAVCGDYGRPGRLGEGSLALLRGLGEERLRQNRTVINAGIARGAITIIYPGTRLADKARTEQALRDHIESVGQTKFAALAAGNVVFAANVSVSQGLNAAIVEQARHELAHYGNCLETENPLRQRVNEYWTKLGEQTRDGATDVAWSAAFVSWVMYRAGCGSKFPYHARHASYVKKAISNRRSGKFDRVCGYRPEEIRIAPGDVLSMGRGKTYDIDFEFATENSNYLSHCDIVVGVSGSTVTTIGGNVGDGVVGEKKFRWTDGSLVNVEKPKQRVFAVLRLPPA